MSDWNEQKMWQQVFFAAVRMQKSKCISAKEFKCNSILGHNPMKLFMAVIYIFS
jgi:hypothetical protein